MTSKAPPRSEAVDALAHAIGGALNRRPRGDLERSAVGIIVSVLHRHLPAILAERQGALEGAMALVRRIAQAGTAQCCGSLMPGDTCIHGDAQDFLAALAQPAEHGSHDDCGEECPCFERGVEASRA